MIGTTRRSYGISGLVDSHMQEMLLAGTITWETLIRKERKGLFLGPLPLVMVVISMVLMILIPCVILFKSVIINPLMLKIWHYPLLL